MSNTTRTLAAFIVAWAISLLPFPAFAETQAQELDMETYVIGPEDVLEVHVWKEESLSREVLVRSDGRISLPLINDVQAEGLTPPELADAIAKQLEEYITAPKVSVIVRVPRDFKVYVLGNVRKPGTFALKDEITFLQAIALAGGLNEWASKKIIVITNEDGRQTRRIINYKDVVSGEALDTNIVLKSGDTIVVQ